MRDYAADGVQMFPTSDEPSGYNLHSVRIARLFVREIAEVEVLTLYTHLIYTACAHQSTFQGCAVSRIATAAVL